MFGLDPNIQVEQRSLFLPWIPVSIPRLRSGTRMTEERGCSRSGLVMTADGASLKYDGRVGMEQSVQFSNDLSDR